MHLSDIWNTFHSTISSFVRKRVNDPDDAADLVQDIFLKIHINLSALMDRTKLANWIYQIVRNSLADYYKKKKFSKPIEFAEYIPEEIDPFVTRELAEFILPFVNQLESKDREAIKATDIDGMSQKKFAELNGLTYSAAKSRIQRARIHLRKMFDQCCKIDADRYGNIMDVVIEKKCSC